MPRTRPKPLSENENKVFEAIQRFITGLHFSPSIREIGDQIGIDSPSQVRFYLDALQEKGYIERDSHVSRSIRILRQPPGSVTVPPVSVRVPIVGRIQAGKPVPVPSSDFSLYDQESFLELSEKLLPKTSDPLYALEVRGDSMRDALVADGDIVILRSTRHAQNGDMIAAWLKQEGETTLKRYYLEGSRVKLQPANPAFQPIYVDADKIEVQGQVVMVIRQLSRPQ